MIDGSADLIQTARPPANGDRFLRRGCEIFLCLHECNGYSFMSYDGDFLIGWSSMQVLAHCKFCTILPAKLKGKQAQCQSAGQVHPAEESRRDKPASPGDQPSHEKAPEHCSAQKAGKEDHKMHRLWLSGYGCKYGRAKPCPENDVHRIAQGKKCPVGEIAAAGRWRP